MTIEFRAIEATCRRFIFNAYLLESQFLHDAPTGLVAVEIADADCLRAKVAECVPNSCVCRLRRHALSGVFRRHPVPCLIDVLLIGKIQCGSNEQIPGWGARSRQTAILVFS